MSKVELSCWIQCNKLKKIKDRLMGKKFEGDVKRGLFKSSFHLMRKARRGLIFLCRRVSSDGGGFETAGRVTSGNECKEGRDLFVLLSLKAKQKTYRLKKHR